VHQYIYHDAASAPANVAINTDPKSPTDVPSSTLNTLGYSPFTLSEYLGHINEIVGQRHLGTSITTTKKPFILSVTGTPDEVAMAYALIANAAEMDEDLRLCMGKSPSPYVTKAR
jgi:dihydroorotate dehydrogenase (fumarate)